MIELRSDKIICGNRLIDGYLYIEDGKIAAITEEALPAEEHYDFRGKYVSPGFIDIHTHGGGGYAFMNSSTEDVVAGCNFHLRHGTTTILPTISAGELPTMRDAVENIACAMRNEDAKGHILGAHMEGPYLSARQAGAQCPTFIVPPQKKEYQQLIFEYGDSIKRWTYAPENDTDGEFCRYLTEHGMIASAGHTDACYSDMRCAMENGCRLITHLYSCTSTVTRDHGFRRLGAIESAFLHDELAVEIIADGKHLPPELIRMIVKIKGKENVALVTDSLAIAGTSVTEGVMSGTEFIVEDGVCKLRDRTAFAGSIATADRLIRVMVQECGFSVTDAVYMMTKVPAELLQVKCGDLCVGYAADIVVFDADIQVTDVFVDGKNMHIFG